MSTGDDSAKKLEVTLRGVRESDLPVFFEHQQDEEALHMAAFTSKDPSDVDAFMAHWTKLLASDTILKRTVTVGGEVAGHVASFDEADRREVTYWIGRDHWGWGVATVALSEFLREETTRPLYARAAKDNLASLRVLEKCGFATVGEDSGFANARGQEVEEYVLELK